MMHSCPKEVGCSQYPSLPVLPTPLLNGFGGITLFGVWISYARVAATDLGLPERKLEVVSIPCCFIIDMILSLL